METVEILERFRLWQGQLEREAMTAAVERQAEITAGLLGLLAESVERAEELAAAGGWMGHMYSMYLLAQLRELRAYPQVVRFASLPSRLLEPLCGDFVTDHLCRVLASVCGGKTDGIKSLIENEKADQWARGSAVDSLVTLVAAGQSSRAEVLEYYASLFRGRLVRKKSYVWNSLVTSACDLYPGGLMQEIELAFADGLVDVSDIRMADVRRDFAAGEQQVMARLKNGDHTLLDDAVQRMGERYPDEPSLPTDESLARGASLAWPTSVVQREVKQRVGRNDPCPCGSGKKFKKCCGG